MKRFTSLCEGSSDEETISPSKSANIWKSFVTSRKSISKEERKTEQTTIDDHFRTVLTLIVFSFSKSRTLKRIPTPTKKKPSPKKDNQYTLLHVKTCWMDITLRIQPYQRVPSVVLSLIATM